MDGVRLRESSRFRGRAHARVRRGFDSFHLHKKSGCARSLRVSRNHSLSKWPNYAAATQKKAPRRGAFFGGGGGSRTLVQETPDGGSSQACSAVVASRGKSRTTHIEDFPPDLDPAARAFRRAHPVPSSGRPRSPFGRFYEPVTRRSRGLARCLKKIKRRGPVRSYRWQFCLGGLIRGPSVQPPPAPFTRVITCRNRSPPGVDVRIRVLP